jgi:hypothetical protein
MKRQNNIFRFQRKKKNKKKYKLGTGCKDTLVIYNSTFMALVIYVFNNLTSDDLKELIPVLGVRKQFEAKFREYIAIIQV